MWRYVICAVMSICNVDRFLYLYASVTVSTVLDTFCFNPLKDRDINWLHLAIQV